MTSRFTRHKKQSVSLRILEKCIVEWRVGVQVKIGHDEAKLRSALQIAQGSLVFIDALRAEFCDASDCVHCHLCQITYSAAKGLSRTVLPVSIEMCQESDGAYLWTAIHLESNSSYGGFA